MKNPNKWPPIWKDAELKICLCWMLTEDDNRNNGKKIQYFQDSDKWRKYDPALFDVMKRSIEMKSLSFSLTSFPEINIKYS